MNSIESRESQDCQSLQDWQFSTADYLRVRISGTLTASSALHIGTGELTSTGSVTDKATSTGSVNGSTGSVTDKATSTSSVNGSTGLVTDKATSTSSVNGSANKPLPEPVKGRNSVNKLFPEPVEGRNSVNKLFPESVEGNGTAAPSYNSICRDTDGKPFLPAASLRGFLRQQAQQRLADKPEIWCRWLGFSKPQK